MRMLAPALTAYLLLGLAFGLAFFWRGHAAIAPEARGAPVALRLLWTPAAVALWPVLCVKWWRRRNRK